MTIPTEPTGSLPRTATLLQALDRVATDDPPLDDNNFPDFTARTHETAFAQVRARVPGTQLASNVPSLTV